MFRTTLGIKLLAGALLVVGLGVPSTARACGGFFCSQTPVDQTAERIVFSVNPDDTLTAYVQISYSGEKDAFAWIVPVPSAVQLDVFPQLALNALDLATEPRYFTNSCYFPVPGGTVNDGVGAGAEDGGVTLIQQQNVGPFATVTLEGTSAALLVKWLRDNNYRLTDEMIPFIQKYVDAGSKFLAMRLLPDAQVSDIQPIVMTYQGTKPVIPIRLTTVAAQPEMGIVTWILSDQRYAPENYVDLKIEDNEIEFGQYGFNNNYLSVVSRDVDKVGGQAFVTEYAGSAATLADVLRNTPVVGNNPDAADANQKLIDLLASRPYITRLYTRMSAEEMTTDPIFGVAMAQGDVSNVHDLSDPNQNQQVCNNPPPPPLPCDFTYCGRSGACVNLEGDNAASVPACACADIATARPTNTTAGQLSVYCEPVAFNFMPGEEVTTAVCDGFSCGAHGECVAMNANPTCRCEAGYGAVAKQTSDGNGVTTTTMDCVEITGIVPAPPQLPPIGMTSTPEEPNGAGGSSGGSAGAGNAGNSQAGTTGTSSSADAGTTLPIKTDSDGGGGGCAVSPNASREGYPFCLTLFGVAAVSAVRRSRRGRAITTCASDR